MLGDSRRMSSRIAGFCRACRSGRTKTPGPGCLDVATFSIAAQVARAGHRTNAAISRPPAVAGPLPRALPGSGPKLRSWASGQGADDHEDEGVQIDISIDRQPVAGMRDLEIGSLQAGLTGKFGQNCFSYLLFHGMRSLRA